MKSPSFNPNLSFTSRLTFEETQRYQKQIVLPQWASAGQERLKATRVLMVGVGGLGSPAALYLAAAGVGHISLIDPDIVELSNLQRQILYSTQDIGQPKVQVAKARLLQLNPHVNVDVYDEAFTFKNARQFVRSHDLVIDGTDNFRTRYLVNDACSLEAKPFVYGSVGGFVGWVGVFNADEGPCYRCLYPEPPSSDFVPSCAAGGVLGVVPGVIGLLQATEALKWISGCGQTLHGRLLRVDLLTSRVREFSVAKDPVCLHRQFEINVASDVGRKAENDEIEMTIQEFLEYPPPELQNGGVTVLIDVRETEETAFGIIPGALCIPLSKLDEEMSQLNSKDNFICYCASGSRSQTAARKLLSKGFTSIRSLRGGYQAYQDNQLPLAKEGASPCSR